MREEWTKFSMCTLENKTTFQAFVSEKEKTLLLKEINTNKTKLLPLPQNFRKSSLRPKPNWAKLTCCERLIHVIHMDLVWRDEKSDWHGVIDSTTEISECFMRQWNAWQNCNPSADSLRHHSMKTVKVKLSFGGEPKMVAKPKPYFYHVEWHTVWETWWRDICYNWESWRKRSSQALWN